MPLPSQDLGARARVEAAFAREERRGLMLATATRSAAVAVIMVWLALVTPESGLALAWVVGTAGFFLVTGLAQFAMYLRGTAAPVTPYVFMLLDALVLAVVLLVPNPFAAVGLPRALPLRYASFMYFFLFLMQAAFSFRPRLLLWTGLCGMTAWTAGFLWIVTRPEIVLDPPGGVSRGAMLASYLDPNYVSVIKYENEMLAFLLVSAGLALLVRRSRTLVAERAEAERTRSNLARYFSPKVVDTLAERDEPLGRVRRQAVGVLFADLVGFTTMAEEMTPEEVMALLRDFHGRMEEMVFRRTGAVSRSSSAMRCSRPSACRTRGLGTRPTRSPAPTGCGPLSQTGIASGRREGCPRFGWASGSTTARWWPATSGAAGAWPSRPSATRRTSPAGCRPSPANWASTSWSAARWSLPSSGRLPAPTRSAA